MMYKRLEDADLLSKWRHDSFDFHELSMSAPRSDVKCNRLLAQPPCSHYMKI